MDSHLIHVYPIPVSRFRIQIISEGKKRKLIIKNCKLDDAGMITAKTNSDEVSAPLEVKRTYNFNII